MTERILADKPERLIALLRRSLPDWKRKTLEQRVMAGCVSVNGQRVTRNDLVASGDEVVVMGLDAAAATAPARGLPAVYEDDVLIAIDKPAGLLSVSTDLETERTALAIVRESLSRPGAPASLWPVHRLDRETSGVLLFAKSREVQQAVQQHWSEVRKRYLALVEGRPTPADGVIDQPLFEDQRLNVKVGEHPEAKNGVHALLHAPGDRAVHAPGNRTRHGAPPPDPRPPRLARSSDRRGFPLRHEGPDLGPPRAEPLRRTPPRRPRAAPRSTAARGLQRPLAFHREVRIRKGT